MSRPGFAMSIVTGIALVVSLLPATGHCQTPPATTAPPPAAAAQPDPNAAFLAKASSLYYSTTKQGLTGFDCTVHPDWANIFKTVEKKSTATPTDQAADEKNIALLNSVKITLHARLTGPGSGLDWTPGTMAPQDADSVEMLDHEHEATGKTLQGFLQFWIPFVNGSVIPETSAGIDVEKMQGAKIAFNPTYKPTPNGLLVSGFAARIQPPGATLEQQQKIDVGVEYQTVSGFLIPRTLTMAVVGTGTFSFKFDGCTVNPPAQ